MDSDLDLILLNDIEYLDNLTKNTISKRFIRVNAFDLFNDWEFKSRFRMRKETAMKLLKIIEGNICFDTSKFNAVPTEMQLLVAIRYYRSDPFEEDDGDLFGISQPTVSRIVKRISKAIAREAKNWIKFPQDEEMSTVAAEFYKIAKFPGVIGAIDCTHVPVHVTGEYKEEFRNRKGYFSINVQAICDHKMKFTNLVVRWPGSTHDSRIFETSKIRAQLELNNECDFWLIGDEGYPCKRYLLTPLSRRIERERKEKNYNKSHVKTRNIIERTFGGWKKRFNILNGIRTEISTSLNIITACGMLWNFLKNEGDIDEDEIESETEVLLFAFDQENPNSDRTGFNKRKQLIDSHFSRL